jgi:hypothetical protein
MREIPSSLVQTYTLYQRLPNTHHETPTPKTLFETRQANSSDEGAKAGLSVFQNIVSESSHGGHCV